VIGDLVVVALIALGAGSAAIMLGMLLAPRIGRLAESDEGAEREEPGDDREP
jgi:hypothetical protein